METQGLSSSRIRQAHVVVSQVLDAAVRDGLVARNAADGLKLPRLQRREAKYFEPSEIERIAEAMPEPYDLLLDCLENSASSGERRPLSGAATSISSGGDCGGAVAS